MNTKSFIVALALLAVVGVWVMAQSPEAPPPHSRERMDGPGPGMGPGPASRPSDHRLSEERINELLQTMKEQQPAMYERLLSLRESDPRAFNRSMEGVDRFMRELANLPPELREAFIRSRQDNVQAAELVKKYNEATDEAQKAAIRAELQTVVSRQFEDTQKLKEYELQALARRLEELKKQLQERAEKRNEVIEDRVADLLQGKAGRLW